MGVEILGNKALGKHLRCYATLASIFRNCTDFSLSCLKTFSVKEKASGGPQRGPLKRDGRQHLPARPKNLEVASWQLWLLLVPVTQVRAGSHVLRGVCEAQDQRCSRWGGVAQAPRPWGFTWFGEASSGRLLPTKAQNPR